MGLLDIASWNSVCRGYDYCKDKKVKSINQESETTFTAKVEGTNTYEVFMDIEHPKKSKCNCPLANGKRIICKHIVATYFAAFPNEVKEFEKRCELAEQEYEEYQENAIIALEKYLSKCTKKELKEHLWDLLNNGPEWQYDNFIRDYIDVED